MIQLLQTSVTGKYVSNLTPCFLMRLLILLFSQTTLYMGKRLIGLLTKTRRQYKISTLNKAILSTPKLIKMISLVWLPKFLSYLVSKIRNKYTSQNYIEDKKKTHHKSKEASQKTNSDYEDIRNDKHLREVTSSIFPVRRSERQDQGNT